MRGTFCAGSLLNMNVCNTISENIIINTMACLTTVWLVCLQVYSEGSLLMLNQ